jgi:hypothetical protein
VRYILEQMEAFEKRTKNLNKENKQGMPTRHALANVHLE